MTAGHRVIEELSNEGQWFVNMLDDLRSYYAMKFEIGRHLFDAADKYFGFRTARDRRYLGRELGSEASLEEGPGFIQQVAGTTTDFQKLAAGEFTFAQIHEKSAERCPQGRFLERVTHITVTG